MVLPNENVGDNRCADLYFLLWNRRTFMGEIKDLRNVLLNRHLGFVIPVGCCCTISLRYGNNKIEKFVVIFKMDMIHNWEGLVFPCSLHQPWMFVNARESFFRGRLHLYPTLGVCE